MRLHSSRNLGFLIELREDVIFMITALLFTKKLYYILWVVILEAISGFSRPI